MKRSTKMFALGCVSLFSATAIFARGTRFFGVIVPKDNLADCRSEVQAGIQQLDTKKWGEFHYDCRHGFVHSFYLIPGSAAAKDTQRFVSDHWQLFDGNKVSLEDVGEPWPGILHLQHGLRTISQIDSGQRPIQTDEKPLQPGTTVYVYFDFFMKEVPELVPTVPLIGKETATTEALRIVKARNHPPNKLKHAELVFRVEQCDYLRSDGKPQNWDPRLVWWIQVSEGGGRKPVSCYIDALTGQACEFNHGCTSASDPFAL